MRRMACYSSLESYKDNYGEDETLFHWSITEIILPHYKASMLNLCSGSSGSREYLQTLKGNGATLRCYQCPVMHNPSNDSEKVNS